MGWYTKYLFTQSLMVIPFGGLSLQEDCHYLLYPSVGMLSNASYELHYGDARVQASIWVLIYLEIWGSILKGYLEFL